MIGRCTVFTSINPKHLGKVYTLKDGALHKEVAGNLSQGTFTTASFSTATELAALLAGVGTHQALSASLPVGSGSGEVVTEKALPTMPGARARSKRFFALKPEPGFLLLDYDAPKQEKTLSAGELFALLSELVPAVAVAGVVAYLSGSSRIYEGDKCHRGIGGRTCR